MQLTPEEIKRRRLALGFRTQQAAADAVGVSVKAFGNWEKGRVEPRGANLRKLEAVLGDHADDSDTERTLREIDDGPFWAEATRRFFRNAVTTTESVRPSREQPKRGRLYPAPPQFRPPKPADQAENADTE